MSVFGNRVKVNTSTAGTGTVTLGSASSNAFTTFAEAGIANGATVTYCIEEGTDFEIGTGVYTTAGTTLTRPAVIISKIGGTSGTTLMTLAGAATVRVIVASEDMVTMVGASSDNAIARYDGTGGNTLQNTSVFIDDSDRIVVGNTSSIAVGPTIGQIQIHGTTDDTSSNSGARWSADAGGSRFSFGKSRGASAGSHTIVNDNDTLGQFFFLGSDGTAFRQAAMVRANVEGTPGASDMPGRLDFATTPDGATSPDVRMRIMPTGYTQVMADAAGSNLIPDRAFHVEEATAVTNAVQYVHRMSHKTSGTSVAGFGVGTEFEVENGSNSMKQVASIEATLSDPTNNNEDADLSFSTMVAGTKAIASWAPRVKRLGSDHSNATTTGTEVTGLEFPGVQPGTYIAEYWLMCQTDTTTTGIGLGLNFATGTAATKVFTRYDVSTITTASNGLTEEESGAALVTGGVMNAWASQAYSTTAPTTMSEGVGAINSNVLIKMEALVIVTAAGDLELWHSSQVATTTKVMTGSSARLTKTA